MRIDVTDLFDDLFAFTSGAYPRFQQFDEDGHRDGAAWNTFCHQLSDSLFLSSVAERAQKILHQWIPPAEIKRRIITTREVGINCSRGLNLQYERPAFYLDPVFPSAFMASDGESNDATHCLTRPSSTLTLYLGAIPPREFTIDRGTCDFGLPTEYRAEHGLRTMFSGTITRLLELKGNWLLREITIGQELSRSKFDSPRWIYTDGFDHCNREMFDALWKMATEDS